MNCQYYIKICFLCWFDSRIVWLKFFFTDERILIIDDENTWKVILFNIFLIIERMMKNEMWIQNLFDIVFNINVDQSHSLTVKWSVLIGKQMVWLFVYCFYVICQLFNVFTFLIRWLRNFFNDFKWKSIWQNVFISFLEIDTEMVMTTSSPWKTVWKNILTLMIICLTISLKFW